MAKLPRRRAQHLIAPRAQHLIAPRAQHLIAPRAQHLIAPRAQHLIAPRAQHLAAAAALLLLLAGAETARAGSVDLLGTWHVLVHYVDDNTANPDAERWDDRVWVFEKAGSRLRWTEYPIVVFDDETGRFERRGTGQYARILHHWEPDETQRADIADGLQVNDRGSKSKTLRAADGGWASTNRARPSSASVVSYVENWIIRDASGLPTFRREDVLGAGGGGDSLDGVTQYTTTSVEQGGDLLRGKFERDGSRHGSFRMLRAAAVEGLKGDGRTPNEKVRDRAMEALEALEGAGEAE